MLNSGPTSTNNLDLLSRQNFVAKEGISKESTLQKLSTEDRLLKHPSHLCSLILKLKASICSIAFIKLFLGSENPVKYSIKKQDHKCPFCYRLKRHTAYFFLSLFSFETTKLILSYIKKQIETPSSRV